MRELNERVKYWKIDFFLSSVIVGYISYVAPVQD